MSDMEPKKCLFRAASTEQWQQGLPLEAVADALAFTQLGRCRMDAVRVRGEVRDVFLAHNPQGAVYVHLVLGFMPSTAYRLHGLMRVGKGENAEIAARHLMHMLRNCAEAELRGEQIEPYEAWQATSSRDDFSLRNPWLALMVPKGPLPDGAASEIPLTTEPPATAARAAA